MEIADIQKRLQELPHEIQKAGEIWAQDKSDMGFKEDMKKPVLAKRMMEMVKAFREKKESISEWKVVSAAEADSMYEMFLEELKTSRLKSLKSEVKYRTLQTEFEAIRSLSALEKAMTKNL